MRPLHVTLAASILLAILSTIGLAALDAALTIINR